jgi:hypothetical protein
MKLRRATALAFVGWYLMCPPLRSQCWPGVETLRQLLGKGSNGCEDKYPDYDAALRNWTQTGKYDTTAECEDHTFQYVGCKCIASNDSRLKEK